MPRPRASPPCGCCECQKGGPPPRAAAYCCTRGLIIVVDGVASSSTSTSAIRHLDALAAEGYTGSLVLRRLTTVAEQMVMTAGGSSLAEQYLGMRAAAWADSHAAAEACASVGCQPTVVLDCWPLPAEAAQEMCSLMSIVPSSASSAAAKTVGSLDLLFVFLDTKHVTGSSRESSSSSSSSDAAAAASAAALQWLDELVMELDAVPGFRHSVLLSLVLGPGPQLQACQEPGGSEAPLANGTPGSSVLRPRQSWQLSGGQGLSYTALAMLVQRLPGVVRQGKTVSRDWTGTASHVVAELAVY